MNKTIIATAAALFILPSVASANSDHHERNSLQYNGPVELSSVSTLLQDTSMFTEQDVVVEGHLLRQTRKDTYIFSDGEGEIQIELDDDIHLATPIDAQTKVRLYGEYEGGKTPEIEVDHLQVL